MIASNIETDPQTSPPEQFKGAIAATGKSIRKTKLA
jgi:hypothetical protein